MSDDGGTVCLHAYLQALLNQTQSLTEDGEELPRICIIKYKSGIVVYDRLIEPPKPVIDYLEVKISLSS